MQVVIPFGSAQPDVVMVSAILESVVKCAKHRGVKIIVYHGIGRKELCSDVFGRVRMACLSIFIFESKIGILLPEQIIRSGRKTPTSVILVLIK
jgi:hypothetical protein